MHPEVLTWAHHCVLFWTFSSSNQRPPHLRVLFTSAVSSVTKMSFIPAGFFGFGTPLPHVQNVRTFWLVSTLPFLCVVFLLHQIQSYHCLGWQFCLLSWSGGCWFWVSTFSGHLSRRTAYPVKESVSWPARSIQTRFQRPMVQSLHLCSMVPWLWDLPN